MQSYGLAAVAEELVGQWSPGDVPVTLHQEAVEEGSFVRSTDRDTDAYHSTLADIISFDTWDRGLKSEGSDLSAQNLRSDDWESAEWTYQRRLLSREEYFDARNAASGGASGRDVKELLNQYVTLFENYAQLVFDCRCKDDKRGRGIVPDYENVHDAASDDGVVQSVTKVLEEIRVFVSGLG